MLISVVIRTYNEARYLDELLAATRAQESPSCDIEVVLVDFEDDVRDSCGAQVVVIEGDIGDLVDDGVGQSVGHRLGVVV